MKKLDPLGRGRMLECIDIDCLKYSKLSAYTPTLSVELSSGEIHSPTCGQLRLILFRTNIQITTYGLLPYLQERRRLASPVRHSL